MQNLERFRCCMHLTLCVSVTFESQRLKSHFVQGNDNNAEAMKDKFMWPVLWPNSANTVGMGDCFWEINTDFIMYLFLFSGKKKFWSHTFQESSKEETEGESPSMPCMSSLQELAEKECKGLYEVRHPHCSLMSSTTPPPPPQSHKWKQGFWEAIEGQIYSSQGSQTQRNTHCHNSLTRSALSLWPSRS